jgi:deoxyribodipyrimidine photo-lyase
MTVNLYWFRRDLRLADNPALRSAVASADTTYAVFCAPELERLNARQRAFAGAALRSLSISLGKADASLSMLAEEPVAALMGMAQRLSANAVWCERALDPTERRVEADVATALRGARIQLRTLGCGTVHLPESVAERKQAPGAGYRVFPPFYDAWKSMAVEPSAPTSTPNGNDAVSESAPDVPEPQGAPVASEAAAGEVLTRFVAARAADYGVNAEYPGRDATSHLSPYLRFGVLSPRAVFRAVRERMARSWTLVQERMSMEAFLRRLALRDFYLHLVFFDPGAVDEPLQEKMRGFRSGDDAERIAAWRSGKTGYPLVDAAMRQLATQGAVHGHAAVVAASFCTADLHLDWRVGKEVWMQELLAADAALCAGNWQRVAGIGSDQASYPRIYNPVRQAQLFDAQATYVRRWCRELAKLPTQAALQPWALERQAQVELGFFTPDSYPAPIVDHEAAARAFLSRYQQYRSRAS